jgi:hypothetical protein
VASFWGGDELDISRGAETAVRARTRHEVRNQPRLNDVFGVARQNLSLNQRAPRPPADDERRQPDGFDRRAFCTRSGSQWFSYLAYYVFFGGCAAIGAYGMIRSLVKPDTFWFMLSCVAFLGGVYLVLALMRGQARARRQRSNQ